MGIDGCHMLGNFIDQDNGKPGLGQLSTQHPTNSASPTYHKTHRRPHAQVMPQYCSALDLQQSHFAPSPLAGEGPPLMRRPSADAVAGNGWDGGAKSGMWLHWPSPPP